MNSKLILMLIAVTIFSPGCVGHETIEQVDTASTPEPVTLGQVEITEYEGKDLSAVKSFPENSIAGPQYIDIDEYTLEVTGLVETPASYTYDEVISRQTYKKVVKLSCVEGWNRTVLWEGILLRELLAESKPTPGANTVIFHAYDGYSSSQPLEYIMENDIILAHKMNNITMLPERGFPFQLVAESKWGYKWVKWITKIELSDDPEFKGYWESAGYSNTGNKNESFLT